jgi:hypothetical protein
MLMYDLFVELRGASAKVRPGHSLQRQTVFDLMFVRDISARSHRDECIWSGVYLVLAFTWTWRGCQGDGNWSLLAVFLTLCYLCPGYGILSWELWSTLRLRMLEVVLMRACSRRCSGGITSVAAW